MSTKIRTAVRTVVLNNEKEVLLIHAKNKDYFQIPGGGVNTDKESIEEAAIRETLEETGYKVELIKSLGVFDEVGEGMINRSFGFLCKVISIADKDLQKDEDDFENKWMELEKAITVMEKSLDNVKDDKYVSFFERELEFLNRAKIEIDSL